MEEPKLNDEDEKFLLHIPHSRLDPRTDEEIAETLCTYRPVSSEKNVWAFWDKGFRELRPWCRRNILAWVRRLGPSWTVRVLDLVPDSPNHVYQFVTPDNFPATFNEGTMDGPNRAQHASDFTRLAVLLQFGGVYMDVSIMLFRTLDDICWTSLEDPRTPYEAAGLAYQCRTHFGQMINGFIACRKHNPFIKRWLGIFLEMWKTHTNAKDVHKHPLVRHLGLLNFKGHRMFGENPNMEDFSDYCGQWLAYERLRLLREPGEKGFDGSRYFKEHFFLLDLLQEALRTQDRHDGTELYNLFLMERRPKDIADPRQQQAQTFVHELLGYSSTAIFGTGVWRPGMPLTLSSFWAKPGHEDDDCKPGTWGEFLRYGSIHWEQRRIQGRCLTPIPVPEEEDVVITAGHLEVAE